VVVAFFAFFAGFAFVWHLAAFGLACLACLVAAVLVRGWRTAAEADPEAELEARAEAAA